MADHNSESEYKGGQISPAPGTPDTGKPQEIFSDTKSKGYEDITQKDLEPKHPEEFPPIPLSITPLTNLMQAVGIAVFTGNTNVATDSKTMTDETQKQIEQSVVDSIKADQSLTNNLTNSISSSATIEDTVKKAISKYVDPDTAKGIEITSNVIKSLNNSSSSSGSTRSSSSSSSTDSAALNNFITKLQSLEFINLESIDFNTLTKETRNLELLTDPEAVITTGSIDNTTNQYKSKIQEFVSEYRTAVNSLISSLGGVSSQTETDLANSVNTLNIAYYQTQMLSTISKNSKEDFSTKKLDVSDLPEEWRP